MSITAIVLLLLFSAMALLGDYGAPRVTISKQTTFITDPLRPDGYVDYVASLNQRAGRDVKAETNAAVPFFQAMGPHWIERREGREFFQLLGVTELPERGDYFVALDDFLKTVPHSLKDSDRKESAQERLSRLERVMQMPWSRNDYPELDGWLKVNEKPLRQLIAASKRTQWFCPLVASDQESLLSRSLALSSAGFARAIALPLLARAMQRLEENRPEESWSDLIACHRLARLLGQGPFLQDATAALTLDQWACAGDQTLLQHASLSSVQIAEMQGDLASLSPLPNVADKINVGERFAYLHALTIDASGGPDVFAQLHNQVAAKRIYADQTVKGKLSRAAKDWNVIFALQNAWIDRIVEAFQTPAGKDRKRAMEVVDIDFSRALLKKASWKESLFAPRRNLSQRYALSLQTYLVLSCWKAAIDETLARTQLDLTKLAFALTAYRADHDSYPAKLADLTPEYLSAIPMDMFSASDLMYRLESNGCVFYSVGVNNRDDEGRSSGGNEEDRDCDDLCVRLPKHERRPAQSE